MASRKVRRTRKKSPPVSIVPRYTFKPKDITPRVKARLLVTGIQDAVIACLKEQRHLFGYDTDARGRAMDDLAKSFYSGRWAPEGLAPSDVRAVPFVLVQGLVHEVGHGSPVGGYENAIWQIYEGKNPTLPALRNPWRSSRTTGRRANGDR